MDLPEIDVADAVKLLAAGETVFVDVRDAGSYSAAHVPGAKHIDDSTVQDFVSETDRAANVVVYCYRGHNSLGATAFFIDQGFQSVSSLRGGYTAWQEAAAPSESDAS